jgi:methanethiol S-methyltransferase
MRNATYLFIDIITFILFGILHSFLASFKVKNFIARHVKNSMPFYRLAYNLFSLWLLFFFYERLPRPDIELFELKFPWDIIILIPQFLSLAGIIWTFRFFSFGEFLGISQLKRWLNGSFKSEPGIIVTSDDGQTPVSIPDSNTKDVLDEILTLKIEGPYKVVRHPLYLFTIIFLILRPTMDLFYLVFLIFIITYFYIGSFYEERKLVAVFGDQYKKYQDSVPRLFPIW